METTKNTTPQLNPWMTIKHLEDEYFIKVSTQNKMRMAGTLPYSKIGRMVRYFRPDIDKMFADAKVI